MNISIEINGTLLFADAITVTDANADGQCERALGTWFPLRVEKMGEPFPAKEF